MMLIKDKVVLVTGGGRNVGAGIVRSLAGHGATLAINCYQSVDLAQALAGSIEESGGKAGVWQCDIRDTDAVKKMVEDIVSRYGRIDAVVNNVGGGATGKLDELTWDQFVYTLEMDVKSVLNTCQAVHPFMAAQGGGSIINIGSDQHNTAGIGIAPNVAGKSGGLGLTRCLIAELGPENIRVNTVSLGWTRTDRTKGRDTPDNPTILGTPLRRMCEPEYVGDVCAFLISDLGKYISGAYIPLNGGRTPQMG